MLCAKVKQPRGQTENRFAAGKVICAAVLKKNFSPFYQTGEEPVEKTARLPVKVSTSVRFLRRIAFEHMVRACRRHHGALSP